MIRHNFKKKYGQNFLVNVSYAAELVNALDIQDEDTVIEIGPGDGMVTNIILNNYNCKLICIEIDYDLLPNLIKRFSKHPTFNPVHQDVLQLDLQHLIEKYDIKGNLKIIGSLPYNISKKIIDKFINFYESDNSTSLSMNRMAFIIQEEVAKNYVAEAPKSTFLSNYLQIFAKARKLKSIPAQKFYPQPMVNGAILRIDFKEKNKSDKSGFRKFLRVGFASPRKTLLKNLSNNALYSTFDLKALFSGMGLKETIRPAELTFDQWEELFLKIQSEVSN